MLIEDAFVRHALELSTSEDVDMEFAIRAGDILQTLACLSQMIRVEADDPQKVRQYASLVEEQLRTLGELMRPRLWNPTKEKGHLQAMIILDSIRILTAEPDHDDGLIVTFSDGTTAGYVIEELLELRPCREQTAEATTSAQLTN